MELYTGEQLFETHEELEHLALVERIIDELPEAMVLNAPPPVRERYMVQTSGGRWRLPWPEKASSPASERHVYNQAKLHDQVGPGHRPFADFVSRTLKLDPSRRSSAARCLNHDFFNHRFDD